MLRKLVAIAVLIGGICAITVLDLALSAGGNVAFLGGLSVGVVAANVWLSA